jgi:hypothetical protein
MIDFIIGSVLFVVGYNVCFYKQVIIVFNKELLFRFIGLFLMLIGSGVQNIGGVI